MKPEEFEKIARYIDGRANGKEKEWVESLFTDGENNHALRNLLEKEWNLVLRDSAPSDVDLSHLLDHVHHMIRKMEYLKKQSVTGRFVKAYMKAAAILLIPLLAAGGLFYSYLENRNKPVPEQQVSSTIYAPLGARVSFNLPDGTTGMLNSGSQLTYQLPFNKNRKVSLEGEAFFTVSKDEDHPFEINLDHSTLKVLGTCFNVMAYPAEDYIDIVLKEGKLEFAVHEGAKKTMLPSERLVFKDGRISKTVTIPDKITAWTEGRLVFNNDPMAEVARRIERWYNVQVVLADKELEKYSFRGTFEDDSLEEVFQLLSLTSPIKYKISPRTMLPDGSYEKEIVTVYLKKSKY